MESITQTWTLQTNETFAACEEYEAKSYPETEPPLVLQRLIHLRHKGHADQGMGNGVVKKVSGRTAAIHEPKLTIGSMILPPDSVVPYLPTGILCDNGSGCVS